MAVRREPLVHKWSMNEDGSIGKSCFHPSIISLSGLVPLPYHILTQFSEKRHSLLLLLLACPLESNDARIYMYSFEVPSTRKCPRFLVSFTNVKCLAGGEREREQFAYYYSRIRI
jgi:hypothetical protein